MGRCAWVGDDPLYIHYHDEEWGVPEVHDQALFEKLILEGFQAGLSWITILRKRENFRKAFDQFEPEKIARYSAKKLEKLMNDEGIIRNRAKIEASVKNAKAYLDLQQSGSDLRHLFWDVVDGQPIQNNYKSLKDIPGKTALSTKLSKELKRLGFAFVGPTTVYAHFQAMGLVNDHVVDCPRHEICAKMGGKLTQKDIMSGKKNLFGKRS